MSNIDEEIAKVKLQQRIDKEQEMQKKNLDDQNVEPEITIEKVCEGIEKGEVILNEKSYKFKYYSYFDGILQIPFPIDFFEVKVDTDKNLTLVNDKHGISFVGNYFSKCTKKQDFNLIKASIEKNFKDMKIYIEWVEDNKFKLDDSTVFYAVYKTPTASGRLYNLLFMRDYKGTVTVGNYNCFEKDLNDWKFIINASVRLMKFKK